jgi:hypothetical protein
MKRGGGMEGVCVCVCVCACVREGHGKEVGTGACPTPLHLYAPAPTRPRPTSLPCGAMEWDTGERWGRGPSGEVERREQCLTMIV